MLVSVTSPSQRPHEVTLTVGGHRGSEKLATGAENPQLAQFSAPFSAFFPYCPEQLIWRVGGGSQKGRPPTSGAPEAPLALSALFSAPQ